MKRGFARPTPVKGPLPVKSTVEVPTPLKLPPPEGKPWWTVVLVIGLIGLVGAMVWVSFASGARSFAGAGSLFPVLMVGGLMMMLFGGRGSQDITRTKLDALRARFLLVIDGLRGEVAECADHLDASYRWHHPPPGTLEAAVGGVRMWERKADPSDMWFGVGRVGVGMTDLVESQAAQFSEPADMPTDIELEPVTGKVLQEFVRYQTVAYGTPALVSLLVEPGYELRGPRERVLGVMRALLCQLVFSHGPDHLRLVVVTCDVAQWDWVKWLPHAGDATVQDAAGPVRMVYASVTDFLTAQQEALSLHSIGEFKPRRAGVKDPIKPLPHTLVVCDTEGPWELVCGRGGLAGLTFFDVCGAAVPACADPKRVLHVDAEAVMTAVPRDPASWEPKAAERPRFFAVADQMDPQAAEAFAERMAHWRLAEAYETLEVGTAARLGPRDVLAFYGIDDAASIDFDAVWGGRADINSAQRLQVPLGNRADNKELFFLDMKELSQGGQGPHGVMAGTTGSGKTEMLRATIMSLLLGHRPQDVQLVLADLKGGSGVKPFTGCPHVAHVITDLEEDQALMGRFIEALQGEIARRKKVCDAAGVDDATEYNKVRAAQLAAGQAAAAPLPALVVVIDEFAELYKMMGRDIDDVLDGICRQGRSYWIHLLMASQTITSRAEKLLDNMDYRMALRLNTSSAATAIGVPNALNLKRAGECYFLHGTPTAADLTRFRGEWLWREYRKPGVDDLDDARPELTGAAPTYFAPQLFTTEFTPVPLSDAGEVVDAGPAEAPPPGAGEADLGADDDDALMRPKVGRLIIDQLRQVDFEPYRLWQPPLDEPWSVERLVNTHLGRRWDDGYARSADLVFPIGVVDRPFKHDQHPLTVDTSGSGANVLIVGAQGSGKTTVLQALICAAALTHTPQQVQFYCLAFSAAALGSVAGLPHVGTVAQALDPDGVRRTVAEMSDLLARRRRSFEECAVMSMEVFRRRKFGGEPGKVPEDSYGDVFVVIDNYTGLASDYEVLLDPVSRLIIDGPTFGIHVVAAVGRTSELRPAVRDKFGSRVELRLGDTVDSTLVKPALAAQVPEGRPGRGMIAQNYTRLGADPVGLHTLMARPTMQAGVGDGVDSRSVVAAVTRAAAGHARAPAVRRLPALVPAAKLVAAASAAGAASSMVWAISETEQPVYFDHQHLMITGQKNCGRTTVCAAVLREIGRVYAPPAVSAAAHSARRGTAQVWLVDPRRQLLNVLDSAYVARFAYTTTMVKEMMAELAGVLAARQPEGRLGAAEAAARRWEGPEIFLVIDDAQRLPAGFDSPLAPIADFVEAGEDVGLRVVYSRLFGGFLSGVGADPVLRMLQQAHAPLLVMDSDPDAGPVRAKWKGHPMVPGRGYLMGADETGTYVQVAAVDSAGS